jgi:hypothetical protein
VPAPFGLGRRKIELLFLKIECLEAYIREWPAEAGLAAESVAIVGRLRKELLSPGQAAAAVKKVMAILEADKATLDSKDLEELCRVEK